MLLLHGFFHLLAAFRARFGALLATFVEDLLRANQLDEGLLPAIPLAKAGANDAEISAIAVSISRRNVREEAIYGFARGEVRSSQPTRGHVSALAKGNHLLDMRTHRFGFCYGCLDAFFEYQRAHQVSQQRAPVAGVTSKFPGCFQVTHVCS